MRDLFQCPLSVATIQRAARVSSAKLVHTEQRLKAAIRNSAVIGVDETGLRVAGSGAYIHVARTEGLTHYGFDVRRGKAAMDEIGILPRFTGTMVRDGFSSYRWYEQCRHSLCNVHLLRDLRFLAESSPTQKVWTEPFAKLLLKIKETVTEAQAAGGTLLTEQMKNDFLRRYDQLVKKAARLNPPEPKTKVAGDSPKQKPVQQPTPHSLVNRLQRRRDEVLRFMSDKSVPFDRYERRSQRQRSPVPPNLAFAFDGPTSRHAGWRRTWPGSRRCLRAFDHPLAHSLNAPCCGLLVASPDRYLRLTPRGRPMVRSGLVGEGLANNRGSASRASGMRSVPAPIEWRRLLHRPGAPGDLSTWTAASGPLRSAATAWRSQINGAPFSPTRPGRVCVNHIARNTETNLRCTDRRA